VGPSTKDSSSSMTTVVVVVAPWLLGLGIAVVAAALTGDASRSPEAAQAAGAVWNSFFWTFLLTGLIAATVAVLRIAADGQRDVALGDMLAKIGDRDFEGAMRTGRDYGLTLGRGDQVLGRLQSEADDARRALTAQRTTLEAIGMSLTSMNEILLTQSHTVREVARTLEEDMDTHRNISASVEGLSHSAEESSSSILEMVAINNEVRENIHNLALSVQETTTAIEEMTFSSKEVAKNIEELSTAAEETAASMNQMDVSIGQVETNANETSKLSETVSRDAETGVAAIKQTIQGIDKIKDSSRIAAEVIGNLGQRISEIGNILNVIDDVAEQTNLLALNAAIIAAQAGEHGRGFAVVADEIKALAERTGASTKEIAELVKTIQDQSRRATNVMSQGVDNVEEGVRLGHNAEDALRKIVDSAKRSTLMIQAIAQATVEQAKGSKQVTNAISRIAETVQQIAYATAEQAKGSEHIMQSAERMRGITQQVERSADEQNRGGRQITQSIENIREVADQISHAQKTKGQSDKLLMASASKIMESGDRSLELFKNIEKLLGKSVQELDTLGQVTKR
jgi:methyl-accepting chemotaxis protein